MLNKILPLAQEMISFKSVSDNAIALREVLELALSNLKGHTIERFKSNGVQSALVYNVKTRPKKFQLVFNGHLDVIPGKDHQFHPKIQGDRLYGVGSMDMKANVACLIMAFNDVAKRVNYPIGLQLVTDEEVGGFNGTRYQIDQGVRPDFVIAGEPTNLNIVHKAKGVFWGKITAKGKSAHGAYPWRGDNAIWKMNHFLRHLGREYSIPTEARWATTVNVSKIETSNVSFNKVPDNCVIWLDIRYVPEESDHIVTAIEELLPRGFSLEVVAKEPALSVDKNNRYIKSLQRSIEQVTNKKSLLTEAHGSSDARHYSRVFCDGIEFGPIGGGIGSDNEWVDIPSLDTYQTILKNFCFTLQRARS